MDAVQKTFRRLQHLYMSPVADETEYSQRLRRLYVLYRLPGLQSIDGVDVTDTERRLARPLTPNGQKVSRSDWMEQRLAEEDRQQALRLASQQQENSSDSEPAVPPTPTAAAAKKEKVDRQAWLAEVLDEEEVKEPETPQSVNVEVDLAGRLTEVALSPPDLMKSDFILETTSSVATADCAWAASCGHFFRPDSMRRQWNKSRLGVRFSSRRTETKLEARDGCDESSMSRTSSTCSSTTQQRFSIQTENEHVTVLETEATSPITSKTIRFPTKECPPRLILDAGKSSPDQRPSLVIKAIQPLAPTLPSTSGRSSPSRSLSSPFPIQFRARSVPQGRASSPVKGALPGPQPSRQSSGNRTSDSPQRIRPSLENSDPRYSNNSPRAPSSIPRKRGDSLSITGISKLSDPLPMQRTKSTPSRKGKRELPPPCPGGGRRLLRTLTPRISKWKKQTARSTSIIDDEEESEDDDGQEESMLVVIGTA
jgi:hypothetical protein